jgi:hypothetical protein
MMSNQNEETREITIQAEKPTQGALAQNGIFSGDMVAFENGQRMAQVFAKSTLVPKDYQGNIGNVMIAMEMAQRCNANPMAVMQNLYIIHGRPSWSSQFVIAALNGCGRFSPIRFDMQGQGDNLQCQAWAYDVETGDRLDGVIITMAMAKAEGWVGKAGSKWKTMPELMIRYRAAKFFGNLYAPDILMGMSDENESTDIAPRQERVIQPQPDTRNSFEPVSRPAQPVEQPVSQPQQTTDEPAI